MINKQSGNVLIYILIAVGLLAALSYAVTQTSRGGAKSISKERTAIAASEIIEYGEIIANAVMQLRLRGYKDTEISFENGIITGYTNANCSEDGCKIFAVDGGGVNYTAPSDDWLDSANSAETYYKELYFHGEAASLNKGDNSKDDLILFIPYIKKSVCLAINEKLDINPATDDLPSETTGPFETGAKFTGAYSDGDDYHVYGEGTTGETDILSLHSAGCTEGSGNSAAPASGTYHFYQVLIPR